MNFLMVAVRPRAVQFVSHLPCKRRIHIAAHCESFFRKRKHSRGLRQPAFALVQPACSRTSGLKPRWKRLSAADCEVESGAGCSSPEGHDPKSALTAFAGAMKSRTTCNAAGAPITFRGLCFSSGCCHCKFHRLRPFFGPGVPLFCSSGSLHEGKYSALCCFLVL